MEKMRKDADVRAINQLEKYKNDRKIRDDGEKPLKKLIVITIGKNDLVYEEIN